MTLPCKQCEIESLRQQLAAALAAIKVKDAAVTRLCNERTTGLASLESWDAAKAALAIQPDDAALKAWLGEPVAWKDTKARNRIIFPPMKPEEGDDGWIPLYSPKGLK